MDANVPTSRGTATSPANPRRQQGAKPKPQTTPSPDWREPVTAGGGHQGRKLHPPYGVQVVYNSSIQEQRTYYQYSGPGASMATQGTTARSAPRLDSKVQPAPTDQCGSEDGRTQSTTCVHDCTKIQMASNKNKPKKTSSTFEDGGVQFARCTHTVPLEDHIGHLRSVMEKNEEELKAARQEVSEVRSHFEDQLNRLSSTLQAKHQELQSQMERNQHNEAHANESVARMQNYYTQELHTVNVALAEKKKEAEYFRHSLAEKEAYVQRKMEEARSLLQQKNEELKSFKDRVAGEVALSIKTGKAESMNNPVSKSRLKEMYEELRTQWPAIKKHLNNNRSPESVKVKLQEVFSDAMQSGEQQKTQVEKLYRLNEADGQPVCQKVHEYRKATIQYLQLTLYHNKKDELQSKASLLQHEGGAQEAMEFLVAQCQWLGNLMALNDPPLHPDWENHDPGMNKWDILPRNLHSTTVL